MQDPQPVSHAASQASKAADLILDPQRQAEHDDEPKSSLSARQLDHNPGAGIAPLPWLPAEKDARQMNSPQRRYRPNLGGLDAGQRYGITLGPDRTGDHRLLAELGPSGFGDLYHGLAHAPAGAGAGSRLLLASALPHQHAETTASSGQSQRGQPSAAAVVPLPRPER
jgi:hypothetical protein